MMNRRAFLEAGGAAAGLLFVGCSPLAAVAAAQGGPARRRAPVVLRGRRIRTVDVHAHCLIPKATALLARPVNRANEHPLEGQPLADRLRVMDAQGIDVAVLSINPNWYDVERDLAAELIRIQNDALAEFCAANRERFAAFASVALQFPDLAVEQLQAAAKNGFRGVAIGGSVEGVELADAKFHPFFARAEELGSLVFIHPQPSPVLASRLRGNGPQSVMVWNPIETTLALEHLIFEGTLDRFPGLRVCAAHGGGYLPSYAHRMDSACATAPNLCEPGKPKRKPTEYLKQMYFDSLVFTPEALRHLAAEVGADRIMIGTDYPFPWVDAPVDHVLRTPGLSDAQREAILGGTAARLLGL